MDFDIQYLSFSIINIEGSGEQANKSYKQIATLDEYKYSESTLKPFLDGEFMRITKRKVERHPKSEQVPTKIGRFLVEPGYDLASNPNYNLFNRIRSATQIDDFSKACRELIQTYTDTTAVRGGVLIIATAKLNKYFDEPFVFVMKCDFEQKVASISDEKTLINNVEMAITTKNMKSIQYPYMPEEGMLELGELKIHQASHSRYFEDFLKGVTYEKSMPEIVKAQVVDLMYEEIDNVFTEPSEERVQAETDLEVWATSPKRELQEKWTEEQVMEATTRIVEHAPEIELKLKLDHMSVKGLLSDFGDSIHIAKVNGKYVVLLEGDMFQFEKNVSPVEFLKPADLHEIVEKLSNR
ncbi:DUF3900 domain-containing protein [Anaerobacillus alkaliphilus]|uniref:DUF3900 domain-containing protein n=1 Tax=Anaerobacillus alkaliphilus TaxID=1548597 RepID=A0A4Q0VWN2_9BACI|nr:DUF3900 domain-containing protein [Anaerobacillus alkaliphilus]RXJ04137.1 DUF3900 domain-containing protein [Anaerobacillus alkaliphilus]